MTDIVERLRAGFQCDEIGNRCRTMNVQSGCVCAEAADEIERLRAELSEYSEEFPLLQNDLGKALLDNERLRAALRDIASGKYSGIVLTSYPPQDPAVNAARAALEGK